MAKYERVATDLREQILAGCLTPGEELPPERRLAHHHGVSLPTLRHALDLLHRYGLIDKRHGKRARVGDRTHPHRLTSHRHTEPTAAPARVTTVEADAALASLLDLAPGTPIRRHRRIHRPTSDPHRITTTDIPWPLIQAAGRTDLDDHPPTPQIADALGQPITRVDDDITARAATPTEIHELDLSRTATVLTLTRYMRTPARTVALDREIIPADQAILSYTTGLTSPGTPPQPTF